MDHDAIRGAFGHVQDAPWDGARIAVGVGGVARKRRVRTVKRTAAAGALVAASALLVTSSWKGEEASVPVVAEVVEEPSESPALAFTDGTEALALSEDTVLETRSEAADRVEVHLAQGAARFSVTPGRAREFIVDAGNVRVVVLGTVFEVYRSNEDVRVRVERGLVRVEWDNQTQNIAANEDGVFPQHTERRPRRRARWRVLAERGDYERAFDALPNVRSAQDLWDAADVARRAGRGSDAIPYLERLIRDYPRGRHAQNASFTLGKVLSRFGRHREAAAAFTDARERGGALTEAILVREVQAYAASGARARAEELAAMYRRRFPDGRFRGRIDALMNGR